MPETLTTAGCKGSGTNPTKPRPQAAKRASGNALAFILARILTVPERLVEYALGRDRRSRDTAKHNPCIKNVAKRNGIDRKTEEN